MKSTAVPSILLLLAFVCSTVYSYGHFIPRFPNGKKVIEPCTGIANGHIGIGHVAAIGAGSRNQFGRDYFAAGFDWKTICNKDSDGDGISNGQELGDPQCLWNVGDPDPITSNPITHPGICTPLNAERCRSLNYCDRIIDGEFSKGGIGILGFGVGINVFGWLMKLILKAFTQFNGGQI